MSGYNCGYRECEEYAALRAEVAALREECDYWREKIPRVEKENAEARALLARLRKAAEDYWLAMGEACDEKREGHETCEALAAAMNEVASFLHPRPDPLPGTRYAANGMLVPIDDQAPVDRRRDEARGAAECVCQPSYYQDGVVETHGPTCPARDEAPRCTFVGPLEPSYDVFGPEEARGQSYECELPAGHTGRHGCREGPLRVEARGAPECTCIDGPTHDHAPACPRLRPATPQCHRGLHWADETGTRCVDCGLQEWPPRAVPPDVARGKGGV